MTKTLQDQTVADILSRDLVTLDPEMTLRDAIGVLDQQGIHGAPVIANGALLGVLTATDILSFAASAPTVPELSTERAPEDEGDQAETWQNDQPLSDYFTDFWDNAGTDVAERIRATDSPEWDVLQEHVVSEAMSVGVRAVQESAPLSEAAAYILHHRIHRALVMDGDRLVGVVSAIDFLRAIAGLRQPAHVSS
jgi:CBS domain-containing protein